MPSTGARWLVHCKRTGTPRHAACHSLLSAGIRGSETETHVRGRPVQLHIQVVVEVVVILVQFDARVVVFGTEAHVMPWEPFQAYRPIV